MKNNIYVGLVHYPVYNKHFEIVTTSITNLDIHDIARSCITFGVKGYYLINRLSSQESLLSRVQDFWKTEIAQNYNSDRVEAFSVVRYARYIEDVLEDLKSQELTCPLLISTTAVEMEGQKTFLETKEIIQNSSRPVLLIFGTGNGLTEEIHRMSDIVLKPIKGYDNYNHLSVRSAVAIILDRLISEI
ncbi:MAG: RNA methyltransferase [Candidatus Cloacimonetes bacterium]|nr:RNA methyltransferase [Candidatus Cloacimonadota bacterium]